MEGETWYSWAMQQVTNLSTEEIESGYKLEAAFASMSVVSMNYWLGRFILEGKAISGKDYSPDSVYQLCCRLQRSLRNADHGDINLFVTGFWKSDQIVTLGLLHFIGPANGYTCTLHIHSVINRLGSLVCFSRVSYADPVNS